MVVAVVLKAGAPESTLVVSLLTNPLKLAVKTGLVSPYNRNWLLGETVSNAWATVNTPLLKPVNV